jgi:hypothetical protein
VVAACWCTLLDSQLLLVLALREEQRQGEASGGGTEQVRVEVGVANSEQRRGGNGLVRLELRGVVAGYPWPRGSSLARECMRVHVLGHTAANRCTRCRATTKPWRLSAAGHHLANGGARSGTACPAVVWLAPACVCRRETLDGELQAGRKRQQLDLARSRQRIAWLKVEPRLAFWAQLARQ